MDITHDNVCSSVLSCFYSHLLSTGRPISSLINLFGSTNLFRISPSEKVIALSVRIFICKSIIKTHINSLGK